MKRTFSTARHLVTPSIDINILVRACFCVSGNHIAQAPLATAAILDALPVVLKIGYLFMTFGKRSQWICSKNNKGDVSGTV